MSRIIERAAEAEGERLDVFAAELNAEITRSRAAKLIKDGLITVDGCSRKAGYKLSVGEVVKIELPEPKPIDVAPQDIPLDIIYQDDQIAIINKPQGMVVHPAAGNPDNTLVNALLFSVDNLSGINGELRPGIVHRLDKDTSGLIAIAKTDAAHQSLCAQLKTREMGRVYWAVVDGSVKDEQGVVNAPIGRSRKDRKKMAVVEGGREAITRYEVLERFKGYTLVKCSLKTGRTHQIRVHMAHIGHPVAGDPLYGGKDRLGLGAQALHALELHLIHPKTGEQMSFFAPLPEKFSKMLYKLRNDNI